MSKKAINATHYEVVPALPNDAKSPDVTVHAIIETPKNSAHKYALKNEYGIIAFSEVLPAGMHWPYDYGFLNEIVDFLKSYSQRQGNWVDVHTVVGTDEARQSIKRTMKAFAKR